MPSKSVLLQLALLCLFLATLRVEAQPAPQRFPSSLAPGLYYYFHPGDTKPRIHYVPDPTNSQGDPFANAVKPLPIRGQENFPALPLDTLQRWTYSDFLQYQEQHRPPAAEAPAYAPPEPAPGYLQQQSPPEYQQQQPYPEAETPPQVQAPPLYPQTQAPSQAQRQQFYPGGQPPLQQEPYYPQQQGFNPRQQQPPRTGQRPFYPGQAEPPQQPFSPQQPAMQQPGWPGNWQPLPPGQGQAYLPPGSPFQAEPPEPRAPRERKRVRGVPISQMQQALDLARKAFGLLEAGRNEEARDLLERAALLDPNPNSAPIHSSLARAHERLGNMDKALAEYQTALSFEPNMASATMGIAGCYHDMGKIPEAIHWYQKCLELKSRSIDPAQIHIMIASLKKAAEKAPCDDPNGPDYLASVTSQGTRRWSREKLPLKVYIDAGKGVSGFKKPFREFLVDSFNTWCRAVGNRVTWIPESDPAAADITCQWARSTEGLYESTGAEGGQTLTQLIVEPDGTKTIEHGTITLLTYNMEGKPVPEAEMKSTALHEVGHVLGLGGHSSNPQDIMFFTVTAATATALSSRDMATLSALYTAYPAGGN